MLKAPPLVVTLASDRLAMFEFGIAAEFFALARPELDFVPYRFAVAAADPLPLRGLGGIRVDVDGGLDLLRDANLIVVPGWRDLDETPRPEITTALRDAVEHGARVASICSGAFLLAHAGLLDGRRATTHWRHTERLARLFPKIRVEPDVLYIDEGNVMTSAGSAAGIDLLLHLVRKDYGPHIANTFARRMVVPPHRDGGQAQFAQPVVGYDPHSDLAPALEWARANLGERLTVDRLAAVAHMSPRTFARRFRDTLGVTPLTWLVQQRVRVAQELLETSDEPVERIAGRVGFGTAANLRQHFHRVTSVSPQTYRQVFRRRATTA